MKKEKENMRRINAAERYFIYFGSPEVYKVMTAAKDIWYAEKWQQREAREEAK